MVKRQSEFKMKEIGQPFLDVSKLVAHVEPNTPEVRHKRLGELSRRTSELCDLEHIEKALETRSKP